MRPCAILGALVQIIYSGMEVALRIVAGYSLFILSRGELSAIIPVIAVSISIGMEVVRLHVTLPLGKLVLETRLCALIPVILQSICTGMELAKIVAHLHWQAHTTKE